MTKAERAWLDELSKLCEQAYTQNYRDLGVRKFYETKLGELKDHVREVRSRVLPASRLPKVIEAWEEPPHPEFAPRTAWSLFNAFTEVQKANAPRAQLEGSLRLSAMFRRELALN